MKKLIERMREKQLAKKLSHVALGTLALGMIGFAPSAQAADINAELKGGNFIDSDDYYVGNAIHDYIVTITESSTPQKAPSSAIIGHYNPDGTVTGAIRVNAHGNYVHNSDMLHLYGGMGKVGRSNSIQIRDGHFEHIYIVGFNGDSKAKDTSVNLSNVTLQTSSIAGVSISLVDAPEHTSAENTVVTLTGTSIEKIDGDAWITGVTIGGAQTATAIATTINMTDSSTVGGITGADVLVNLYAPITVTDASATAKNTSITLNRVATNSAYGAKVEALVRNQVTNDFVSGQTATAIATSLTLNDTIVGTEDTTSTSYDGLSGKVIGADVESGSVAKVDGVTVRLNKSEVISVNNDPNPDVDDKFNAVVTGASVIATDKATLNDVTVIVKDSQVGTIGTDGYGDVTGVYVSTGEDITVSHNAGDSGGATVHDTTVVLDNATVTGDVIGVEHDGEKTGNTKATNTRVVLTGAPSTVGGTVYGHLRTGNPTDSQGDPLTPSGFTADSDSTLVVNNVGSSAGNIADFTNMEFNLPSTIKQNIKNGEAVLTLTDNVETELPDPARVTATIPSDRNLSVGDEIILIEKIGSDDITDYTGETLIINSVFASFVGEYAVENVGGLGDPDNDLTVTVTSKTRPQQQQDNAKSVAETAAASIALLNSGADFVIEQALSEAKIAAADGVAQETSAMMPFAAFGGGSMKYKSGSHIDSKGWNAAIGFAKEVGDNVFGIAIEHGRATYDSYVNAAHGNGKNKYTGASLFGEIKKASGVHYDAAIRAGRAKSDYNAVLYAGNRPYFTNYSGTASYYGLSLGIGKETKLNEKSAIDLYGRFYYSHLGSNNVRTNRGDEIELKKSDSSRLRLGTRYSVKTDEKSKAYAGLAWQYEFAGKARAVVNGIDAPSPSLKGHSAMLELGWQTQASKNLAIDLGLVGWTGKQRGITGGVGFKWFF